LLANGAPADRRPRFARGNKKKTAELLKLSLKTIYNKIKEYGLEH
jgi:DNA-binding NtrC family response regulator